MIKIRSLLYQPPSNLEVNEYHFSEDEARKKAKVAPPDPPTSRAELTEKNKLWKREKASLVEKLETSVIEVRWEKIEIYVYCLSTIIVLHVIIIIIDSIR